MNNNISNGDETIRRMGGNRHLLKDRQKQYNLSQKTVYVMPALQYCLLVISFRETKQCINQSSVTKKKHTLHMILLYVYVRYCNSTESTIKKRPSSSFLYKYTCTLYIHASVLRSKRCILYSDIKRV